MFQTGTRRSGSSKEKGFQEKHKISDRWERDPYEVVKQRQDGLPVFVVTNNGKE